jgi:hypothetical protein
VTRGNDLSFRPDQPAYRGQSWAPATERSSHLRGLCPSCCRAGGSPLPLTGRRAAWPSVPGGQGASRWLLPGGRRGLSAAALARVGGGRIEVISPGGVPGDLAGYAAGISRRPGTPARCPGLAPSRISRWCAHRVPADARDRVRRDAIHGPAPDDRPAPRTRAHRAVGMIPVQPSPAPSPPWPGSDEDAPGIPGAAGTAWRDWRWRAASASCGQPLVPTGPQSPAPVFRIMAF